MESVRECKVQGKYNNCAGCKMWTRLTQLCSCAWVTWSLHPLTPSNFWCSHPLQSFLSIKMVPYHGNHKKKKKKTKNKQSSTDRLAEVLRRINHEVVEFQHMFSHSQIFQDTEDQGHGNM